MSPPVRRPAQLRPAQLRPAQLRPAKMKARIPRPSYDSDSSTPSEYSTMSEPQKRATYEESLPAFTRKDFQAMVKPTPLRHLNLIPTNPQMQWPASERPFAKK